jgi:hypothetical protein
MIAELNAANRAAEEAARVNVPAKPGSPSQTVHPVVARHVHPSRIRHDPNKHQSLRGR